MRMTRITAVVALALALALGTVPAAVASSAGSVSVSATIRPSAVFRLTDTAVLVRANAPWHLTLETVRGAQTVGGAPTSGEWKSIPLPDGSTGFALTLD